MLRVLLILALMLSGLPRLGIGSLADRGLGTLGGCALGPVAPTMETGGCCGSGSVSCCPLGEGGCPCAADSVPSPDPRPDAPMPRTDRDSITGVLDSGSGVTTIRLPTVARPACGTRGGSLGIGRSHNEICARLGVWRT